MSQEFFPTDPSVGYQEYIEQHGEHASSIDALLQESDENIAEIALTEAELEAHTHTRAGSLAELGFDSDLVQTLEGFGLLLVPMEVPRAESLLVIDTAPNTLADTIAGAFGDDIPARTKALMAASRDFIRGDLEENWGHLL